MATSCIEITYAAHTASCTFLLDGEGICRRIVMAPTGKRSASSRTASRCVGAQYVASLDGSAAGGLVEMPRVGAAMLFARVDERGRVSLVRTGVVTSFESKAAEDPFVESDSVSVETSAPVIPPSRGSRERERDPDYYDPSDRTQRIPALREDEIAAALNDFGREEGNDLATAEYAVAEQEPVRTKQPATLRKLHPAAIIDDDEDDRRPTLAAPPARQAPDRGMLPRRSDPRFRTAAAVATRAREWAPPTHARPAAQSDVQVTRRRRGG